MQESFVRRDSRRGEQRSADAERSNEARGVVLSDNGGQKVTGESA